MMQNSILDSLPTRRLLLEILADPDNHPLLWQITPEPYYPPEHNRHYWIIQGVLIMNPLLAAAVVFSAGPGLVLIPLAGFILGLRTAYTVTSIISKQKETGRFELLKTTPPGEYGIHLLVVQAIFRHKNVLFGYGVRDDLTYCAMLCVPVGGALAFWGVFLGQGTFNVESAIIFLVAWLNVAAALYVDLRQSIVLGTLCALVAATWATSRLNARLIALTLYIGVQLASLVAVIASVAFAPSGVVPALLTLGMMVAVVMALREAVIGGLDHFSRRVGA